MTTLTEPTAIVRENFLRDGYVALNGFLSPDEVAELRSELSRFVRDKVPAMPPSHVFYENKEDKSTLKQLQRMFEFDAYFHTMMFGSRFEAAAEAVLAGPVAGKNLQYFNKPPGVGQPTPPHQDGYYFMLKPCEAVTMWLALENVDEETGCVRYVRGSHERGMRPHGRTGTLGFSQGITDYGTSEDRADEVPMIAQPGDLLLHHAMTIHRADGNRSTSRTRQAMGFIYYSAQAKEDTEAHAAYQKKLAEEMAAAGKI